MSSSDAFGRSYTLLNKLEQDEARLLVSVSTDTQLVRLQENLATLEIEKEKICDVMAETERSRTLHSCDKAL